MENKKPTNDAARLIMSSHSTIRDLHSQQSEIQASITRYESMIETLLPAATWGEEDPPLQPPEDIPETPRDEHVIPEVVNPETSTGPYDPDTESDIKES